jgi:uncharacterized protein YdcH (DUF465 family)
MASKPPLADHPQRERIIEALVAGESSYSVAQWCKPTVHPTTIWRFRRNCIAPKLSQVEQFAKSLQDNILQSANGNATVNPAVIQNAVSALAVADPLLNRVNRKYERYDDMIAKAQKANDFGGFSAVDRAETQALRLHAELTGRLQSAQPTTLVQIVIGAEQRENPVERADDAHGETIEIAPARD